MRAHEFGCPLVLAASGLGVIALCQAAAQQVLEFHSGHEQGGVMWIQTAIRLVAQHEAVITVVDDEALGDAVDSVVQRFLGLLGAFLGGTQFRRGGHLARDVPAGAAVAEETAVRTMHRRAADRYMQQRAILARQGIAKITEWPACLECCLVLCPSIRRYVAGERQVPAMLADTAPA